MNRFVKKTFTIFLLLGISSITFADNSTQVAPTPVRPTKAIHQYVATLVKKYKFDPASLTDIMHHAQYDPRVIHKITHPFEKKE